MPYLQGRSMLDALQEERQRQAQAKAAKHAQQDQLVQTVSPAAGAILGGLIGTLVSPGAGTIAGASIGGTVGAGAAAGYHASQSGKGGGSGPSPIYGPPATAGVSRPHPELSGLPAAVAAGQRLPSYSGGPAPGKGLVAGYKGGPSATGPGAFMDPIYRDPMPAALAMAPKPSTLSPLERDRLLLQLASQSRYT